MGKYLLRRLALLVPVMLGVSLLTFTLMRLIPGDPVLIMLQGEVYTATDVERLRAQWGFDQPGPVQYLGYLGRLLSGDLGRSFLLQRPVLPAILERLPATVELACSAMLIALALALPIGVLSALRPHSLVDRVGTLLAIAGLSLPSFWLGLLAILVFGVALGWLPTSGRIDYTAGLRPVTGFYLLDAILTGNPSAALDAIAHLILPATVLGTASAALTTRLVRSSTLEVARQDYVVCARSKGLAERVVVLVHMLRNALIPAVTVVGMQMGALLGGAIVVETIFGWPGIGRLTVQAIQARDYLLLQGIVLVFALTRVLLNLVTDALYGWLDPRIRWA